MVGEPCQWYPYGGLAAQCRLHWTRRLFQFSDGGVVCAAAPSLLPVTSKGFPAKKKAPKARLYRCGFASATPPPNPHPSPAPLPLHCLSAFVLRHPPRHSDSDYPTAQCAGRGGHRKKREKKRAKKIDRGRWSAQRSEPPSSALYCYASPLSRCRPLLARVSLGPASEPASSSLFY